MQDSVNHFLAGAGSWLILEKWMIVSFSHLSFARAAAPSSRPGIRFDLTTRSCDTAGLVQQHSQRGPSQLGPDHARRMVVLVSSLSPTRDAPPEVLTFVSLRVPQHCPRTG